MNAKNDMTKLQKKIEFIFLLTLILFSFLGILFLWKDYQITKNPWGILSGTFISIAITYIFITNFINKTLKLSEQKRFFSIKKYFVFKYLQLILFEANCMSSSNSEKILRYDTIIIESNNIIENIKILSEELTKKKYGQDQVNNLKRRIATTDIEKISDLENQIIIILGICSARSWGLICYELKSMQNENNGDKLADNLNNILQWTIDFLQDENP